MQPYEVFVVTNKEVREKIKPIARTGADHRWLAPAGVCRLDNYTADRINMMFDPVNEQRGFKNEG